MAGPKFYWDDLMSKNHLTVRLVRMVNLESDPWDVVRSTNSDGTYSYKDNYNKIITTKPNKSNVSSSDGIEILKGFIKQSFEFSAENQWGNVKSLGEQFTNTVGNVFGANQLGSSDFLKSLQQHTASGTTWWNTLVGKDSWMSLDQASAWANKSLINYSDYAKLFEGTEVTLPMTLNITLLADELNKDPREKIRRCLGDLVGSLDLVNDSDTTSNLNNAAVENTNSEGGEETDTGGVNNVLEGLTGNYYGMLKPPGNYIYNPKDARDKKNIKGTLCLFIGDSIVVKNLLVQSASIEVSQYTTIQGYPLWVNVNLSFTPATIFTANDIYKSIGGTKKFVESYADEIDKSIPELDGTKFEDQGKAKEVSSKYVESGFGVSGTEYESMGNTGKYAYDNLVKTNKEVLNYIENTKKNKGVIDTDYLDDSADAMSYNMRSIRAQLGRPSVSRSDIKDAYYKAYYLSSKEYTEDYVNNNMFNKVLYGKK